MEPSLPTVKRLFALSGNCCAFPGCNSPIVEDSGTVTGIICHIKARSRGGPRYDPKQTQEQRYSFNNLVLMCARHSKLIDSEPNRFTVDLLLDMKEMHERTGPVELSQADARKAELLLTDYRSLYISAGGHVMLNSPGGVQATGNVVIKPQRTTIRLNPPYGTLASDRIRRNYIKHLIDRYHEFASQQPGRKFSYPAIYAEIKKQFGAKWEYISLALFDELSFFLQSRIDRTMLGRMNRGKRQRNYSTYTEFLEKYEDRKRTK